MPPYIPHKNPDGTPAKFQSHLVHQLDIVRREFGSSRGWLQALLDADEVILAASKVRTPHSDVWVIVRTSNRFIPLTGVNGLATFNITELERLFRLIPIPNQLQLENTFRRFKLQPELIYEMPKSSAPRPMQGRDLVA
jgi:hypothetical protein